MASQQTNTQECKEHSNCAECSTCRNMLMMRGAAHQAAINIAVIISTAKQTGAYYLWSEEMWKSACVFTEEVCKWVDLNIKKYSNDKHENQ